MKKIVSVLVVSALLGGCQSNTPRVESPNLNKTENIYAMSVKYTAENEGEQTYLQIAQRSKDLFDLLEENKDAFVMDAYNYQGDEDGNMLYTQNTLNLPVEIDAGGYCIRVSQNYLKFNPIETTNGETIESQMIRNDNTLNILVPEQYKHYEADIIKEYQELFYFEKVEVANLYLQAIGQPLLDTAKDDLNIHIIYVKEEQDYFTYRRDLALNTENIITDPIAILYTGNIHISYAHSLMSQFVYFNSNESTANKAYDSIASYIQAINAQDSFQKVKSVKESFLGE